MDARVKSRMPDRQFYARSRAFGRFGMRIFAPQTMPQPHSHGHVELNYVRHCRMHYAVDGDAVVIDPDRLLVFWAGVPHQLTKVEPLGEAAPELCNIYLPLDAFLYMPYIPLLQVAVLTGGMVSLDRDLCGIAQLQGWYADYRANQTERIDVAKMEINALLRRACLQPFDFARKPWKHKRGGAKLASVHVRHVVAMVQHVLDHLDGPLSNADVAKVTGLHTNYALSLFTKTMLIPLKQFIIRMRLLRARGLLLESNMAVSQVALQSGFTSSSQFYEHFASAYGQTPMQLRESVLRRSER
jgi:AraC family transcriptional regulator, melibiose operon regulatory protein